MTPTPYLIRALQGEALPSPPFWFMRQAGRYLPEYQEVRQRKGDFLSLCYDPEAACEVTLQPIRRFDMDAAILFSDILVVPHALGVGLEYRTGEGPVLEALLSPKDVRALEDRKHKFLSHLEPVFEAVRRIRSVLPQEKTLIGFAGAPWTVAAYMLEGKGSREYAKARAFMHTQPEAFAMLMDLLTEMTANYLTGQIEAGAQALQLFDSWAGILPSEAFERWCTGPAQEIVQRVRTRHPDIPVIGFPKGVGTQYRTYQKQSGMQAISVDSTWSPETLARELQSHGTVQGNLDPLLLAYDIEGALAYTERLVSVLGNGPFIFNLSHGIVPRTPPEHVARLSSWLKQHRELAHAA